MLIIDDNTFKLLKMKEKLLKLSSDNRQDNLKDYRKFAVKIDEDAFMQILNNINRVAHSNLSLEDELAELESIDSDYQQLEEMQIGFKEVYDKYSFDNLVLSNLAKLNIDKVREKKNAISGYLINLKNIEDNSNRLGELNIQLIDEEKKKKRTDERIADYEQELRSQFLKAEGRIKLGDKFQYTSVIDEYEKIDLSISSLLEDQELLTETRNRIIFDSNEAKKKEQAAETCYNADPTHKYKGTLDEIRKETLDFEYREIMIKILCLVGEDVKDIDEAKEKREKLIDLFKARERCLGKIGKKDFSLDPFSLIKISKQLREIEEFNDNTKEISRVRKEISLLSPRVDEMRRQNIDYLATIDSVDYTISDNKKFDDIVSRVAISHDEVDEVSDNTDYNNDNRVVLVKPAPSTINLGIVHAKTRGVVNKVNMMVDGEEESSKSFDFDLPDTTKDTYDEETTFNPSLVISRENNSSYQEEATTFNEEEIKDEINEEPVVDEILFTIPDSTEISENIVFDDKTSDEVVSDELFTVPDSTEISEVFTDNTSNKDDIFNNRKDEEEIFGDNSSSNSVEFELPSITAPVINPSEANDIFEDKKPFEEPVIFDDKKIDGDDIFAPQNDTPLTNSDDTSFPDVFWMTGSDDIAPEASEYSSEPTFDEQIDKLLKTENLTAAPVKKR